MSQQQLGDALGITFQQVQKYERGTNRVSASTLVRAADTLKISITDLFAGIGNDPTSRRGDAALSTEAVGMAIAFMSVKDARTRRALSNLVDALTNKAAGSRRFKR